ncbi:MCE family protein [Mycolicibacterium rhodesiae]|uniref:Virulence factor Mce n=1 Tax=Mycolicibacterium rhodesiae TaxID=36814 RepID=A0A1X0IXS0_MYCRH|nr:MlaD family protein [Mycolicibacterium rhodesiae]MCV7343293.1 MCE family protein [Mycolicibacterium rhodesiae]ORB53172.1 virulence factor Mce [Mycolicibacterium rhodesiae]
MLTRFIRNQLIIFTVASIVSVAVMVLVYLQVPTLLGIGKMTVKLEMPETGGLYRFSNVTYRGVQLGKVTDVQATEQGAEATLMLDTSPQVPADVQARVLSVSAVGEQYVDLVPRSASGPYLRDGSVIAAKNVTVPQAVGPMLDQASALLKSIPKQRLGDLLDHSFEGLKGSADDLSTLMDSSSRLAADFNGSADRLRTLVDDGRPLLDGQLASTDAIRTWAHSVAGVTGQLADNDPQVRGLLANGPGAADEASRLLNQIKPTLPVLLANLTTISQVAVTYHASLEQLLVLLPPDIAATQSMGGGPRNPTGMSLGDFTVVMNDPPACSVGFLPPSSWRSPEDLSDVDTPDGLYCKLPQDSPIGVRGARNYPCMGKPGKRAPTVEICNSDQPYEPLAMRQHATGAYPIDPNLLAQGIPPDDRTTYSDNIFGPLQGTPAPPAAPPAAPQAPMPPDDASSVAPSALRPGPGPGPSVAVTRYNPKTGQYVTPVGAVFQQSDLVAPGGARSWKDLLPTT